MLKTINFRRTVLMTVCLLSAASARTQDFHFDGSMSRPVLENYLERSISFTELLHDDLTKREIIGAWTRETTCG